MRIFGRTVNRLKVGAIGIIVFIAFVAFAVNQEARTRSEVRQNYTDQGSAL